jgi:hypothetical protein
MDSVELTPIERSPCFCNNHAAHVPAAVASAASSATMMITRALT